MLTHMGSGKDSEMVYYWPCCEKQIFILVFKEKFKLKLEVI